MELRGNALAYTGGTTHRPIPHVAAEPRRDAHAPQKSHRNVGLDWDALRPSCKGCGQPSGQLGPGALCPDCQGDIPQNTPKEPAMPTPEEPPQSPTYVEQIVTVMVASEGHPDPAVRAARKAVANALVALNKTLNNSLGGEAPTLAAVPEQSPAGKARASNSKRLGERVAALGVTPLDIRNWAIGRGIPDVPSRGSIPERLVDAYEDAHHADKGEAAS